MTSTDPALRDQRRELLIPDPAKVAAVVTTLCNKQNPTPLMAHLLQAITAVADDAELRQKCLEDLERYITQIGILKQDYQKARAEIQKVRAENDQLKTKLEVFCEAGKDKIRLNEGSKRVSEDEMEEEKEERKRRNIQEDRSSVKQGEASGLPESMP